MPWNVPMKFSAIKKLLSLDKFLSRIKVWLNTTVFEKIASTGVCINPEI